MNNALLTLGQRIRMVRKSLNLSQEELAHRSGLHRTYVTSVENGKRNLSFCSLLAIAQTMGLTVSELTRNVEQGDPKALIGDNRHKS